MSGQDIVTMGSTSSNRVEWDAFVKHAPAGHLMQLWEWGAFKSAQGWQVRRIGIRCQGELVAGVQMLFRPLPWLPLTIGYVPKGPMVNFADGDMWGELLTAMHRTAHEMRAIFIRIEPNMADDALTHDLLRSSHFRPVRQTNQPRSTLIVDLRGGEQAVFANMRHETRKLIRRASRNGVQVCDGTSQDLEDWYRVMRSTAETKEFPIHAKSFYEQAWAAFEEEGGFKLLLARYQDQVVAAKMMALFGNKSLHLWGGTSPKGREVNASYLLQWEALRWEIAHGCEFSDLWGIPDEISDMLRNGQSIAKDKSGGLWGVYNFKRGFGGTIECYVGTYDYVYKRALYALGMLTARRSTSVDAISGWLERAGRLSQRRPTVSRMNRGGPKWTE